MFNAIKEFRFTRLIGKTKVICEAREEFQGENTVFGPIEPLHTGESLILLANRVKPAYYLVRISGWTT